MHGFTEVATVALKELRELLHRPILVVTLILGPLVILIVFGLGSNTVQPPPRTAVVVPEGPDTARLLQDFRRQFDQSLNVVEYTSDEARAGSLLDRNIVDAVLVLPPAPFETIASGETATIRVLYNQIDPLWTGVVPRFAQGLAGDINRAIFLQNAGEQRQQLTSAANNLDLLLRALDLAIAAADRGDRTETRRQLRRAVAGSDRLSEGLEMLGPGSEPLRAEVDRLQDRLGAADETLQEAERASTTALPGSLSDDLGLQRARSSLQAMRDAITAFIQVPPEVVLAPLAIQTEHVALLRPDILTYFAPAILALIVQHVAVSLGALAMVTERLAGTFDLYVVAPITPLNLLLGKYVAYLIFTLVIAGGVLGVLFAALNVPLLGSTWRLILILLLLAVASVGMGFALSLLAASERQAVQLSMLSLLSIVFFSGFALPLQALQQPAVTVSYALPATYGGILLQDIMLRGRAGSNDLVLMLAGIATMLFAVCWVLLHWRTRAI